MGAIDELRKRREAAQVDQEDPLDRATAGSSAADADNVTSLPMFGKHTYTRQADSIRSDVPSRDGGRGAMRAELDKRLRLASGQKYDVDDTGKLVFSQAVTNILLNQGKEWQQKNDQLYNNPLYNFAGGFVEGSGTDVPAQLLTQNQTPFEKRTNQGSFAYGAGSFLGNVAAYFALSYLTKGNGSAGISGSTGYSALEGAKAGASKRGILSAWKNLGDTAAGNQGFGEAIVDTLANTAEGAAGGALAGANSSLMSKVLGGKDGVTWMRALSSGIYGATYSAGSETVDAALRAIGYKNGQKISAQQFGQDIAVAFAFGTIDSLFMSWYQQKFRMSGNNYTSDNPPEERPKSEYFSDCQTLDDLNARQREYAKMYRDVLASANPDPVRQQELARINAEATELKLWFSINGASRAYTEAAKAHAEGNQEYARGQEQEFRKNVQELIVATQEAGIQIPDDALAIIGAVADQGVAAVDDSGTLPTTEVQGNGKPTSTDYTNLRDLLADVAEKQAAESENKANDDRMPTWREEAAGDAETEGVQSQDKSNKRSPVDDLVDRGGDSIEDAVRPFLDGSIINMDAVNNASPDEIKAILDIFEKDGGSVRQMQDDVRQVDRELREQDKKIADTITPSTTRDDFIKSYDEYELNHYNGNSIGINKKSGKWNGYIYDGHKYVWTGTTFYSRNKAINELADKVSDLGWITAADKDSTPDVSAVRDLIVTPDEEAAENAARDAEAARDLIAEKDDENKPTEREEAAGDAERNPAVTDNNDAESPSEPAVEASDVNPEVKSAMDVRDSDVKTVSQLEEFLRLHAQFAKYVDNRYYIINTYSVNGGRFQYAQIRKEVGNKRDIIYVTKYYDSLNESIKDVSLKAAKIGIISDDDGIESQTDAAVEDSGGDEGKPVDGKDYKLKDFSAYNEKRYGKPWLAQLDKDGKPQFVDNAYTGDYGEAGSLVIPGNLMKPGAVFSYGQKDYRGKGSGTVYVVYDNDGMREISRTDAVKLAKEFDNTTENADNGRGVPESDVPRTEAGVGGTIEKEIQAGTAITGKPFTATLYHGSGKPKSEIYNGLQYPVVGKGKYWAMSRKAASGFGSKIERANVTINNPIVVRDNNEWWTICKAAGVPYMNTYGMPDADRIKYANQIRDYIIKSGYDGLIVQFEKHWKGDINTITDGSVKQLVNVFGIDQVVQYYTTYTSEKGLTDHDSDSVGTMSVKGGENNGTTENADNGRGVPESDVPRTRTGGESSDNISEGVPADERGGNAVQTSETGRGRGTRNRGSRFAKRTESGSGGGTGTGTDLSGVLTTESKPSEDAPSVPTEKTVPEETERPDPGSTEEKEAIAATGTDTARGSDFRIGASLDLPNGQKSRFRANADAIRIAKTCAAEGRFATPDEQVILSKYVGWGGLADAFASYKTDWSNEYNELKELLTPEEYDAARLSTLNAHYTAIDVVRGMYDGLRYGLGFKGGRLLEPSCGTGNFVGSLDAVSGDRSTGWTMVELDKMTGQIAKLLYPNQDVRIQGFQDAQLPNGYYDAVITNVPFSNSVYVGDKRYPDFLQKSLHNYFIARSLDCVHPGGVVCVITSRFTMSAENEAARRYFASKADLIGAVMLPNTAFKENAGTEVGTDILVFKRRADNTAYAGEPFFASSKDNNTGIHAPLNEYFSKHPENVLGSMELSTKMYNSPTINVRASENQDIRQAISKAMQLFGGQIDYQERHNAVKVNEAAVKAGREKSGGSISVKGGKVYEQGEDGKPVEKKIPPKWMKPITTACELRDNARKLMDAMLSDTPKAKAEVKRLRTLINRQYDELISDIERITADGKTQSHSIQRLKTYFKGDPDWPFMVSLEQVNRTTGAVSKADIFSRNTLSPRTPVTHTDNSVDALAVSLNETGDVSIERICELTGKDEATVIRELTASGEIFLGADGTYIHSSRYLSGNVRAKLKQAEALAAMDERYKPNVEALKKVIPEDKPAEKINVSPGATWVPAEKYEEFAAFLADKGNGGIYKFVYIPANNAWEMKYWPNHYAYGRGANSVSPPDQPIWSTKSKNWSELLLSVMNHKKISVSHKTASGQIVTDAKETAAAREMADKIARRFKEWIFEDNRREDMVRLYNDTHNAIATPKYDGSKLVVDGLNSTITLKDHQKDVIQRVVMSGGNTLIAHGVGAGKTYEMIASVMKLRQIGAVRKPLVIFPKNLINQWPREFLKAFPAAHILTVGENDLTPENRKAFAQRVTTGDWDAILMTYEQFKRIPMSAETQKAFYQEQLDELEMAIEAMNASEKTNRFSVKNAENRKASLKGKLEKLSEFEKDDTSIDFESMGIDGLFVDEAHNFKNLFYSTNMSNVSGLGNTGGSQRSFDLYMKVRYLQQLNGGRGVCFATATPVMNSMAEMFIMQKYLQYDELRAEGIETFDAWASQYCETEESFELNAAGKYQPKTSLKFKNLTSLHQMFANCADVLQHPAGLKLPSVERFNIASKPSPYIRDYIKNIGERTDAIRNNRVKPNEDNMLKVSSDGRKAAYSQRMIDPSMPYEEGNKVLLCVDHVVDEYQNSPNRNGTQLIFCDLGTPKTKKTVSEDGKVKNDSAVIEDEEESEFETPDEESVSLYNDMRNLLIAKGIPENEIAFIHDANSDAKKAELEDAVNRGTIRVLIGSTGKAGVGLNVQRNMVALHHLDVPWRPGDLTQREGRIIRQGNLNDTVHIYTYVTEDTFDAVMWSKIERKSDMIYKAIEAGDIDEMDDIGESTLTYAEVKALAVSNPLVKEQVELRQKVQKLSLLRDAHADKKRLLRKQIEFKEESARRLESELKHIDGDIDMVEDMSGDRFHITVGNKNYIDRQAAGKAIIEAAKKLSNDNKGVDIVRKKIGKFSGFDLVVNNAGQMILHGGNPYAADINFDSPIGTITKLTNLLDIRKVKEQRTKRVKVLEKEIDDLNAALDVPFEQAAELEAAESRLNEVNDLLQDEARQPSAAEKETDVIEVEDEDEEDEDGVHYFRSPGTDEAQKARWQQNASNYDKVKVVTDPDSGNKIVKPDIPESESPDVSAIGKTEGETLGEMSNFIKHAFGLEINIGKNPPHILGQYKDGTGSIRMTIANDMPNIAHELGHYFDDKYKFTDTYPDTFEQFWQLPYGADSSDKREEYPRQTRVQEGFAEFIRMYVEDRQGMIDRYDVGNDGEAQTPISIFTGNVEKEDLANLDKLSGMFHAYATGHMMHNVTRTQASDFTELRRDIERYGYTKAFQMRYGNESTGKLAGQWTDHFIQKNIDFANPLVVMARQTSTKDATAYQLARDLAYTTDKCEQMVRVGLFDRNGNPVTATRDLRTFEAVKEQLVEEAEEHGGKPSDVTFDMVMAKLPIKELECSVPKEMSRVGEDVTIKSLGDVISYFRNNNSFKRAKYKIDESAYNDFSNYMIARHAGERMAQDKRVYANETVDPETIEAWIKKWESDHPDYPIIAEFLDRWRMGFLSEYGVKSGLIDMATAIAWNDMYPHHVPLMRWFDEKKSVYKNFRHHKVGSPFKRAIGSGRDIINVVDSLVQDVFTTVTEAKKQGVYNAMAAMTEDMDNSARFMEQVPFSLDRNVVHTDDLLAKLERTIEESLNQDAKPDSPVADSIVGLLRQTIPEKMIEYRVNHKTDSGDQIIIYKNGMPTLWQINDVELFNMVSDITQGEGDISIKWLKIAGKLTREVQANLTGRNPIWNTANAMRDIGTIMVKWWGDADSLSVSWNRIWRLAPDIVSSYIDFMKEKAGREASAEYMQYLALGGSHSAVFSAQDRQTAVKVRNGIISSWADALNIPAHIQTLGEMIEASPRVAVYKQALREGASPQQAKAIANEVTTDFRMHGGGKSVDALNKVVPFFKAGVAGSAQMWRFLSGYKIANDGRILTGAERAKVALRRDLWVTALAVLGMLIYKLMYHRNPDEYDRLSEYTKNSYYCIYAGDHKFITIPKPREWAVMESFLERSMVDWQVSEKPQYDEFVNYATDLVLPPVISDLAGAGINKAATAVTDKDYETKGVGLFGDFTIAGPILENIANADYLGRPIVTEAQKNLRAQDQYSGSNSWASVWLGDKLNMSPAQIDHFLSNEMGFFWDSVKSVSAVDEDRRDYTLGATNKYVRSGLYSTDVYNNLYTLADEATKQAGSSGEAADKVKAAMYDRMKGIYSKFNKLARSGTVSNESICVMQDDIVSFYSKIESGTMPSDAKAVMQLAERTGKTSILPSALDAEIKYGTNKIRKLNADEYLDMQRSYNKAYYKYAAQVLNARGLTDEDKVYMMSLVQDQAAADAHNAYLSRSYKETTRYEKQSSMGKSCKEAGIRFSAFAKAAAFARTATADKDKSGKTIAGSKKSKVAAYVAKLNLTQAQQAILIDILV